MASLSRGISFRRQGSSGLCWMDTWTFTEDGNLVRITKEEAAAQGYILPGHVRSPFGSSLSRIHDSQDDEEEETALSSGAMSSVNKTIGGIASSVNSVTSAQCPASPGVLNRSKSVGSAPMMSVHHKISASQTASSSTTSKTSSSSRLIKWLKKTFGKKKK